MSKRTISQMLLLMTLLLFAILICHGDGRQSLSQLYVDNETWNQMIQERDEWQPDEMIEMQIADAVYFNGYRLPYDSENHMLLYSLVEDTPQAYDPVVKLVCHYKSAKIVFNGDAISEELIRTNGTIHAMVYSDSEYAIYQLKCTTLPILEIEASADDVGDESINVGFRLFDNRVGVVNRQIDTSAAIHLRGNNSRAYPKNDYRISLRTLSSGNNWRKHHLSLLGMRMDEDWILKGLYNDPEKVREVFSSNLWYETCADNNMFGVANGMQYRYVEVFFDKQYWGIYALGHPIDAKQLELSEDEHIYKKSYRPTEKEMMLGKYMESDENRTYPPEMVYSYEGGNEVSPDFEPLQYFYWVLHYAQQDQKTDLYEIADVNNSIDILLFIDVIQGVDHVHYSGALYNLYMTAKRDENGKTRMLYTPWDMDRTWGMYFEDEKHSNPAGFVRMPHNIVVRLREFGDEEITARFCDRYWQLRAGGWSDAELERRLREYEEVIYHSGAYDRDFSKWHISTYKEFEYCNDLSDFIDYVHKRMAHMDEYIHSLLQ
ncbi:MAG: CotH kinase family protein [Clostridia bacterium]|nr:CotH kinase family protein [Clostridia bacterium]